MRVHQNQNVPGLIVDQYADVIVMQLGSAGAERWRETFADVLQELCKPVDDIRVLVNDQTWQTVRLCVNQAHAIAVLIQL